VVGKAVVVRDSRPAAGRSPVRAIAVVNGNMCAVSLTRPPQAALEG
jgi:hypothetical protein